MLNVPISTSFRLDDVIELQKVADAQQASRAEIIRRAVKQLVERERIKTESKK